MKIGQHLLLGSSIVFSNSHAFVMPELKPKLFVVLEMSSSSGGMDDYLTQLQQLQQRAAKETSTTKPTTAPMAVKTDLLPGGFTTSRDNYAFNVTPENHNPQRNSGERNSSSHGKTKENMTQSSFRGGGTPLAYSLPPHLQGRPTFPVLHSQTTSSRSAERNPNSSFPTANSPKRSKSVSPFSSNPPRSSSWDENETASSRFPTANPRSYSPFSGKSSLKSTSSSSDTSSYQSQRSNQSYSPFTGTSPPNPSSPELFPTDLFEPRADDYWMQAPPPSRSTETYLRERKTDNQFPIDFPAPREQGYGLARIPQQKPQPHTRKKVMPAPSRSMPPQPTTRGRILQRPPPAAASKRFVPPRPSSRRWTPHLDDRINSGPLPHEKNRLRRYRPLDREFDLFVEKRNPTQNSGLSESFGEFTRSQGERSGLEERIPFDIDTPLHATQAILDGLGRKTWAGGNNVGSMQVDLRTPESKPFEAMVELWSGPNHASHKMRVWSEDGLLRPFQASVNIPQNGAGSAMEVRNVGSMQFPISASVQASRQANKSAINSPIKPLDVRSQKVQGQTLKTFAIDKSVASVEVTLESSYGGMPVQAIIELWEGPGKARQLAEVYNEEGSPFNAVFQTPGCILGYGSTIAVRNTGPVEYPLTASLKSLDYV